MVPLVALALAIQTDAVGAQIGPPPPSSIGGCELVDAVRKDTMSQLPDDIRAELLRFFKNDFAEAGAPFNPSDVIDPAHFVPQRRFLRAYRQKGDWIVWYEHGGIGYHLHAVGVRHWHLKSGAAIDSSSRYMGQTARELCAASKAFFDGARTSSDL